ncbi:hypothetical protein CGLO_04869 [Colletotrichum gloeosporioides Cg-14]|uniref:Uncharacterized protein n=1 Tax=Colletotrichum gloeosporioides (strain Cg-14) TaxID=1237896 RepID=T0LTW1_COLGC|nr:hypothetical protein CGLO_04869 [Colletotrichum gloeosporioides Cg-14]
MLVSPAQVAAAVDACRSSIAAQIRRLVNVYVHISLAWSQKRETPPTAYSIDIDKVCVESVNAILGAHLDTGFNIATSDEVLADYDELASDMTPDRIFMLWKDDLAIHAAKRAQYTLSIEGIRMMMDHVGGIVSCGVTCYSEYVKPSTFDSSTETRI